MNRVLERLFLEETLTKNEAKKLIIDISKGKINDVQIIAIASIYNMRNPTIEELLGFYQAMNDLSIKVNLKEFNAIDIVGTGGDQKNTFNISTIASFIVAGAGEKVIKHGNFSSSSITGSSNIFEELGYNFTNKEEELKNQLNKVGFCYLHAPMFHPILNKISINRKKFGTRTIFNALGPLLNPANIKNLLLGVNSLELARMYNYLYQNIENNYAIIHSLDGYDEITLTSHVKCYTKQNERYYYIEELNKNKIIINPNDLIGGKNIKENIKIFINILSGEGTVTQTEVVLINATFALNLLNSNDFDTNYSKAKYSLESGNAKKILRNLLSL
ncbi:anthranilate phosphoribosyltransferase [Blattabacterium cuenoti]|uniref:anthranilate phosphoribosyltransferase n=1 Tax=Blattabacterium cuenoti TaxID=1653831 RepID=UPI00163D0976|nr:anthranilate phosphoribosyltransferase [Blattabacterium cuenoti]